MKPLSYQINILNGQNIILTKEKINRIITKIRNSIYPQDRDYTQNINLIQIHLTNQLKMQKIFLFVLFILNLLTH